MKKSIMAEKVRLLLQDVSDLAATEVLVQDGNTENTGLTEQQAEDNLNESMTNAIEQILQMTDAAANPWCNACLEKDCLVSLDGTCAMITLYLKKQKKSYINPWCDACLEKDCLISHDGCSMIRSYLEQNDLENSGQKICTTIRKCVQTILHRITK